MPGHCEQTVELQKRATKVSAMAEGEWTGLEDNVDELIDLCAVLTKENRALRAQQQTWTTARAKLIEKNELAKSRVESMIVRLKALEQD
jgi:cell division protein ZapB